MERMRRRPGKGIWLMGGGELTREFLKADLVDAVDVSIMPTLLGAGIPLFPGGFPQRDFRLADAQTFAQGSAMLRYERARTEARRKAVR